MDQLKKGNEDQIHQPAPRNEHRAIFTPIPENFPGSETPAHGPKRRTSSSLVAATAGSAVLMDPEVEMTEQQKIYETLLMLNRTQRERAQGPLEGTAGLKFLQHVKKLPKIPLLHLEMVAKDKGEFLPGEKLRNKKKRIVLHSRASSALIVPLCRRSAENILDGFRPVKNCAALKDKHIKLIGSAVCKK